jgi:hypothetical protein
MDSNDLLIVLTVSSLLSTIAVSCIRYCFKSKCQDVSFCCGCLKIHRDTDTEEQARQYDIEHELSGSVDSPAPAQEIRPSFLTSYFTNRSKVWLDINDYNIK